MASAANLKAEGVAGVQEPLPRRVLPRVDRREIAAIFAGGALGRAALAEAFPHPATTWPWPTFGVNIAAALLLGYFITRLTERLPLSSYRRPGRHSGYVASITTRRAGLDGPLGDLSKTALLISYAHCAGIVW